jgi:hypothetical protein
LLNTADAFGHRPADLARVHFGLAPQFLVTVPTSAPDATEAAFRPQVASFGAAAPVGEVGGGRAGASTAANESHGTTATAWGSVGLSSTLSARPTAPAAAHFVPVRSDSNRRILRGKRGKKKR